MSLKRAAAVKLDGDAERARRDHVERIDELQGLPFCGARVIPNVTLADGVATSVAHGLGRNPVWICESVIRGAVSAGYITETRTGDRSRVVTLTANDYGATITVDLVAL